MLQSTVLLVLQLLRTTRVLAQAEIYLTPKGSVVRMTGKILA